MANMYDYVRWRGDLSFEQSPFNQVDGVIFSQLSYVPMDGIVPGPEEQESVSHKSISHKSLTIEEIGARYAIQHPRKSKFSYDITISIGEAILNAIMTTPRYKDCRLFGFECHTDPGKEKQFAAFCAIIDGGQHDKKMLVIFRGTDMSIIGWKEDLNMSFNNSVPSQEDAVAYLEKMAVRYSDPIIVAGHSKGGNLAVYAAAFCGEAIQRRIIDVYANDAPGFLKPILECDGYKAIVGRIRSFIPHSSLVGLLLEHGETPTVVKSAAIGVLQHDLGSWEVMGNKFTKAELTHHSRFIDNVLKDWLDKLDDSQREEFIESIFKVLSSGNAQTLTDLFFGDLKNVGSMINTIKNMDGKTKKMMGKVFGDLFKTARQNIKDKKDELKANPTDRITRAGIELLPEKR